MRVRVHVSLSRLTELKAASVDLQASLFQEQHQLPEGLVVARSGGSVRG